MRWLRWAIGILVLAIVALGLYGFVTARNAFPTVDGELQAAGLNDRVEVIRDEWGIPHIYASTPHDLFFAQGFTHAQERFWQMDFWRHIGSARTAELFGEGQVEADIFLRSLGWERLAQEELAAMEPELRQILEWYAEGVNAYLEGKAPTEVSFEYAVLPLLNSGYEIEPWTPVNTLTWAKVMSWDLSGDMDTEIARAVLAKEIAPERVSQLFPPFPNDHPVIVPADQVTAARAADPVVPTEAIPALVSAGRAAQGIWDLTGGGFEGIGSNNWVIGGSLTESGMPILADDPHLGIQMPSIWFANGLHCSGEADQCPYQLAGFSFPGTPGIVIGHNDRIAWGVTNQGPDVQDLYIERVNPDNPAQYLADGEWVDFETRTEIIEVAGGDDITYQVLSTRHGPVISGIFLEEGELDGSRSIDLPEPYVVALSWQTLEPSTLVEAIISINRAGNWEEFRAGAALWDIASQNLVYADIEGNIGYQATGEVPVRAAGTGEVPVPGWDSEYEWVGTIPTESLPHLFNPPRDYIESANQPVVAPGSEIDIGGGAHGYRAARIEEMISAVAPHTVETSQRMQFDSRHGGAVHLLPHLLSMTPDDERITEIQARLRAWSEGPDPLQASGDSVGAGVYEAVWRHLLAATFHDEVPEEHWPEGGSRWFEVVRLLLETPEDPWWDDITTTEVETREQTLTLAMTRAHDELADLLGDDPSRWTWGNLHRAVFENQSFGQSGIPPLEWVFNRSAPPRVGGGEALVNAVGWNPADSFQVDWLPSMRMVIDLADLSRSTLIHTTGQSGHVFHPHYDDMIELWTDGDQVPMRWTRQQVLDGATNTLVLIP